MHSSLTSVFGAIWSITDYGLPKLTTSLFNSFLFPIAMGLNPEELELPGGHAPRIHGLPDLRRSEGTSAEVHQQTWQVQTSLRARVCV